MKCRYCGEEWIVLVGTIGELHENECELRVLRDLRDKLAETTMLQDFGQLMYRAQDLKRLSREGGGSNQ